MRKLDSKDNYKNLYHESKNKIINQKQKMRKSEISKK